MPKSFMDLVNEAKSRIKEIDVPTAAAALRTGKIALLDVREPGEYSQGHIEGAVNIPRGVAELEVPRMVVDPKVRIICYCAGGNRSALVADHLTQMGYESVVSIIGRFQGWTRSDQPVVR